MNKLYRGIVSDLFPCSPNSPLPTSCRTYNILTLSKTLDIFSREWTEDLIPETRTIIPQVRKELQKQENLAMRCCDDARSGSNP